MPDCKRKKFPPFTFVMLLLLISIQANAQLVFKRDAELSHNTAFSVTKDKLGFIWIGTGNGLNRFDGNETKIYKPSYYHVQGEMKGRVIKSKLLEDNDDRIWFSTDITLNCFDKRKERFYNFDLNGKGGVFANPVCIENNMLWLASISEGVFQLNIATGESRQYMVMEKDETGNTINLMYHGISDLNGFLWFASTKGLLSFDIHKKKWKRYLPGKPLYAVAFCRDTIFAAEGKHIRWFHSREKTTGIINFTSNETIHTLHTDAKNNLWIGDAKGNVYVRDAAAAVKWNGSISGNKNNRSGFPIYSLYADTSGMLWAGTYSQGLWKAETSGKIFNTWPIAGIENASYINSIYENGNNLLLGTFDKGMLSLNRSDGISNQVLLPNTNSTIIYGKSVPLIQKDSKGNIWSSISGYLQVKENKSARFSAIKMPVPSNALLVPQLWCISEYNNGWLAGTTIGLYHIIKQGSGYRVTHLSKFGQDRIFGIWISPKNEIWIAHESGGVNRYKNLNADTAGKIFPDVNVRSFAFQPQYQIMWLSSFSGVIAYHLPSGKFKIYSEDDGLMNNYIAGIIPLKDELWISTDHGLSKAKLKFNKGDIFPKVRFQNFTTADGLPDNSFNIRAFHRGLSGDLYFGTPSGIIWFNPEKVKATQKTPAVKMISILVNEKAADSLAAEYIHNLSLPYHQNTLFFRFQGIDYSQPENIHYAYKLEGWDKDWVYSKKINEVRYSRLPHGNYKFLVRATNSSVEWNNEIYSVTISIQAPFWETWWFKLLAISLIMLVIILVTRYVSQNRLRHKIAELEKQQALEEERKRISREMHDDIGAGLTRITLISEVAKHQSNKKELTEIAETSRQLVSSMSEIIWSIDPQHRSLTQLFSYLREQLNKLLEPSGIKYTIMLPDKVDEFLLTSDEKRNVLLITKEVVHNAIKHSQATNIVIKSWIEHDTIHFEISDDGKGFNLNETSLGNGLKNIKHRLEKLNAIYIIDTHPGTGVVTSFSIPLKSH